ncbi:unnamed protein product [Mycena citricolor]|uniref:Acid phosphatase n=1 Tax=Mycena citricolor TaxID=2018698 RepID=A0AAD2K4E4_9AGAR|nr:unnamed protein product [Mycena citricolor]
MKQSLRSLVSLLAAASSIRSASAAVSQAFAPPSPRGPLVQTANYTAFSNSTLDDKVTVAGKVFDRIMIVWLENTDFATAAATPTFQKLAKEGILFTDYNSVTHPSQPNYIASMGGDFFGAGDDTFVHIPSNITTVIDLLEEKGVSWAAYQESIPTDGFFGYSYTAPDYLGKGLSPYTYYMRKHNPPMIYDAVAGDAERVKRIRSFNDFANDAVNGTLPQWMFVTPNMVNDAHDTTIDFAAEFLDYWLVPLLSDTRVNGDRTLILLTFDETETYSEQNTVYTVALGRFTLSTRLFPLISTRLGDPGEAEGHQGCHPVHALLAHLNCPSELGSAVSRPAGHEQDCGQSVRFRRTGNRIHQHQNQPRAALQPDRNLQRAIEPVPVPELPRAQCVGRGRQRPPRPPPPRAGHQVDRRQAPCARQPACEEPREPVPDERRDDQSEEHHPVHQCRLLVIRLDSAVDICCNLWQKYESRHCMILEACYSVVGCRPAFGFCRSTLKLHLHS